MRRLMRLIDLLNDAEIDAPTRDHVAAQPITIRRDTRFCLFQHPDSRIVFPPVQLGSRPSLCTACGLKEACWDNVRGPVEFRILVRDARSVEQQVASALVDVRPGGGGRAWIPIEADLDHYRGQTIQFVFITHAPGGDGAYCWAGWSNPTCEDDGASAAPPIRPARHKNVLFITADALRADHLGCYGHPLVHTPHIDALARDGVQFLHARSQSVSTPGSTASLLTGLLPPRHGIMREWGTVFPATPTLPGHLRSLGYHSVFAPSEADIARGVLGIARDFDEIVPCLATPHQPGSVTVRALARWLDRRPEAPFFAWLHLFDCHPPCTPPEPFRSLYYQGDPSDPVRRYRPDRVRQVRAVESLLRLELALAPLERGAIDADLIDRLEDTAAALAGRTDHAPDLVDHLHALGAPVRRGLSPTQLAAWLEAQLTLLRAGRIDPDLTRWLRDLVPHLCRVERELLSWLAGVTDYRYPLAQYMGAVSHLDANIGALMAALRERDLYETTTVVFCSPHGECLGLGDEAVFHHHLFDDAVLRIPLVIKPANPAQPEVTSPVRVDGVIDAVDVLPTLLDSLGLPGIAGVDGSSRWENARTGPSIPDHDSLAFNLCGAAVSLYRHPFLFERGERLLFEGPDRGWRPGERRLTRWSETSGVPESALVQCPHIAEQMEARLNLMLDSMGVSERRVA